MLPCLFVYSFPKICLCFIIMNTAAFFILSFFSHFVHLVLYFTFHVANCGNAVWELICLQVSPAWHSRSLCPEAVWIYRHEWWCAAWSRRWGGGTAHVGPGPIVFQRAWVWFRIPTPAHPQNQGRDHLHHCSLPTYCYVETYCHSQNWLLHSSWEPIMCCSCVRIGASKVASQGMVRL